MFVTTSAHVVFDQSLCLFIIVFYLKTLELPFTKMQICELHIQIAERCLVKKQSYIQTILHVNRIPIL